MIRIQATVSGGMAASIADGEVTYTFQGGAYDTVRLPNGDPAVIAPNGVRIETTPAKGMVGSPDQRMGNGARTNPDITGSSLADFDARAGGPVAGGGLDSSMIVPPGHKVFKAISHDTVGPGAENRKGVIKQWSVLHVLAEAPPQNSIAPAVWTGANRPWDQFDLDAVLGDLPSYADTSDTVSWDSLRPRVDHRDIGAALGGIGATPPDYESLMVRGTAPADQYNYGLYICHTYDQVLIGLLSNGWSDTDKAEAAWRLAQIGYDNLMASYSRAGMHPQNGGHFLFDQGAKMLAIKATGRVSQYVEFAPCMANMYHMYFLHDAGTIADLLPHDSPAKPAISRLRQFIGTAGTDSEGRPVVDVEAFRSAPSSEGSADRFAGGEMVRERDGATCRIIDHPRADEANPAGAWRLTLDDLPSGTTTADKFWIRAPDGFEVFEGMPDWRIFPTGARINPLWPVYYRESQQVTMQHRFIRALGMMGTPLDPWNQYMLFVNGVTPGKPTAWNTDLITPYTRQFITAHSASILAIPQVAT